MTHYSRRDLMAGAAALSLAGLPALAQGESETHGLSAFGDLKYGPDVKHFAYVNPNAPKGGTFSQQPSSYAFNQNPENFNSLNSFIFRGEAPPGMERTFATLMARAYDEPDALYGLAARAVRISPDRLTYRFILREEAAFHDGTPLRAEDVAFSLMLLKEKGHPFLRDALRDLIEAVAEAPLMVRVTYGKDGPATLCSRSPPRRSFQRLTTAAFPLRRPRSTRLWGQVPIVWRVLRRGDFWNWNG